MYCTKCGKEITGNSKYCIYCGNGVGKRNQKNSYQATSICTSILLIIISICFIYQAITTTKNTIESNNKRAEDITATRYTFNCPYCRAYVSVKEKDLFEYSNEYSGFCPNCNKIFDIDKKTHKVTVDPKF